MSTFAVILSMIKLVLTMIVNASEKNKRKQKKKQEIIDDIQKAIKNRDASAITIGFSRINRM
jgi:preprotein translocase subunit YajC